MEQDKPLFDSSRAALSFALNADRVEMPRPFMNKAMAEAPVKKPKRKKKVKVPHLGAGELVDTPPEPPEPKGRAELTPGQRLRGLEAAGQAGLILAQLRQLDDIHQFILTARMTRPRDDCSCRSPCCKGWRMNSRWGAAITTICEVIKHNLTYTQWPHRRGLGTQPTLRRIIVEEFFTAGKSLTVATLAERGEVSVMTATRHREFITAYLEGVEGAAWLEADFMFDHWGITGAQE